MAKRFASSDKDVTLSNLSDGTRGKGAEEAGVGEYVSPQSMAVLMNALFAIRNGCKRAPDSCPGAGTSESSRAVGNAAILYLILKIRAVLKNPFSTGGEGVRR